MPLAVPSKAKPKAPRSGSGAPGSNGRRIPMKGGVLERLPFDLLPMHDSTWGLCTGADGKIYIGACGEFTGGLSVFLLSWDPDTEQLDYLLEVAPEIGEPADNGRATQSKIHYGMVPGSDGLIYCATHASGAPHGHPIWRPWNSWDDERLRFSGSYIFTFDPRTNQINNHGIGPRLEGTRALALDEKNRRLYGITWPRNHFYIYELDSRRYRDLGRFGEINPQAVWTDPEGNAYTTDDHGFILKYDLKTDDFRTTAAQCPHMHYRKGWHNVPYDVVPSPDGQTVFGVDWGYENFIWQYDPRKPDAEAMTNYGRAWGPTDWRNDHALEIWQLRGLVFGADQKLYFMARCGWDDKGDHHLLRLDPATGEREDLGALTFSLPGRPVHIASATADFYGNLYFAEACPNPTALYIFRPDGTEKGKQVLSFRDVKQWG